MCDKKGPRLTEKDELLFRQVHPSWFDAGQPSSIAFRPSTTDPCPSVDRQAKTNAATAFVLFTTPKPNGFSGTSDGVWAVSVEEVDAAGVSAWEDPVRATQQTPPNDAHAAIHFDGLGSKREAKAARALKVWANKRGRRHP